MPNRPGNDFWGDLLKITGIWLKKYGFKNVEIGQKKKYWLLFDENNTYLWVCGKLFVLTPVNNTSFNLKLNFNPINIHFYEKKSTQHPIDCSFSCIRSTSVSSN